MEEKQVYRQLYEEMKALQDIKIAGYDVLMNV